jgi:hypothetical protein
MRLRPAATACSDVTHGIRLRQAKARAVRRSRSFESLETTRHEMRGHADFRCLLACPAPCTFAPALCVCDGGGGLGSFWYRFGPSCERRSSLRRSAMYMLRYLLRYRTCRASVNANSHRNLYVNMKRNRTERERKESAGLAPAAAARAGAPVAACRMPVGHAIRYTLK